MCYPSSAAAHGKVAPPISFPAANSSTLGAVDCPPAGNDPLSPHEDALLDNERTPESVLITVESDLTLNWVVLVLMTRVYYLSQLIKL